MLGSQRSLFQLPRDICYLNVASMSPLPLPVLEAGNAGTARKGRPWLLEPGFILTRLERARRAAAQLIHAQPEDIALIPSVSYGVATAAKVLDIPRRTRVLVLANDHASPVLEWITRAPLQDFTVEVVQNTDGDWTCALLEAIGRRGAPPVSLASISSVHWCDGGLIDLGPVATAVRSQGGALLVDATQSAGVLAFDVSSLDPDFAVFPSYKWLLGPYGRAFLYVAKRWQNGVPLEQNAYARKGVDPEKTNYLADVSFCNGASRFDMGERDFLITMDMASVGMEMMAAWGHGPIAERLGRLTAQIEESLKGLESIEIQGGNARAPHILSLGFKEGMPDKLIEGLASHGVYAARRLGKLRISPHVYNDEADIGRFAAAFVSIMAQS
jgi:selenocysteine lyase/cysteine desulfurase